MAKRFPTANAFKPGRVAVQLRMDESTYNTLKRAARAHEKSMGRYCAEAAFDAAREFEAAERLEAEGRDLAGAEAA